MKNSAHINSKASKAKAIRRFPAIVLFLLASMIPGPCADSTMNMAMGSTAASSNQKSSRSTAQMSPQNAGMGWNGQQQGAQMSCPMMSMGNSMQTGMGGGMPMMGNGNSMPMMNAGTMGMNMDQPMTMREILYILSMQDALQIIKEVLAIQQKIVAEIKGEKNSALLADLKSAEDKLDKLLADYRGMLAGGINSNQKDQTSSR